MRRWTTDTGLFVFVCMLSIAACSPSEEARILDEASAVHNTMIESARKLKVRIDTALATSGNSESILRLKADLEQWEKGLVEVPGNEQHEHEAHVHEHTPVRVTAQQMLNIQLDLRSQLDTIAHKLKTLTGSEMTRAY
jgi:hypothetical protein